jgi:hypothetical protein
MHHVLYRLGVIFSEVDDSGCCFFEAIAAGALKEGRSRCEKCAMYWVSFPSTNNGQI